MDTLRWTTHDLEFLPDDGNQYEIIDGELYVAKQPHLHHQIVCSRIVALLEQWSTQTQAGIAIINPGLIFTEDNAVVPDVVWISYEQLNTALQADGKLHAAPELVVEVLSPGTENVRRDREFKRRLYSRRNAKEYWIVNWQERTLEIYRRQDAELTLIKTLDETNTLETLLLPGFTCKVSELFISGLRPKNAE